RYEAPSSVKTILAGAFSNCDALREVVISENVNNIQDRVINQSIPYFNPSPPFIDCPNLAAIRVAPENTHYRDDDGVLLTRDSATLLRCPEGKTGKYVVPDGIEYISWNAFYNCSKLTEILFPSTLKRIGEDAFAGCSSLSQIILPNGLEEVLQYAFAGCASLTQVVVPPSVKILDENAFANCPRLEPPELPDGVSYSHIIYD
ncbi:MAG: leucine-rich repeat domain-containing protein, partial [Thermoguttaceae bacterium]|nr:leucine-rich repeat domain-containing protein [Thermoguttaceae bacterium]